MENVEPVPTIQNHAGFFRQFEGLSKYACAISTRQCALSQNQHGTLGFRQHFGKPVLAVDKLRQRLRPGTDKFGVISQIGWLTDCGNGEVTGQPALADTRVQHRSFKTRVCANQQKRIGIFDTGNAGIEK